MTHSQMMTITPASTRQRRKPLTAARVLSAVLFRVIPFLILLVLLFVGILQGSHRDAEHAYTVQEQEERPLPQADLNSGSLWDLAWAFGAQVPYISEEGFGSVRTVRWAGGQAALLEWTDVYGHEFRAVRPAAAAQALLRGGLSLVPSAEYSVSSLPAMCCVDEAGACLYFSNGSAAFSFWMPGGTADSLSERASRITFTPFQ